MRSFVGTNPYRSAAGIGAPKGDRMIHGYLIEKYGRRWKLTYPDAQRTSTRRDAVRLAALHAEDYPGWAVEVQGGRPGGGDR